ncbi:hypothetical protein WA026_020833 [Henosepilachna vigintioctopunctata]|uniref:Uncharacterized protein n=1 Tax=Henosepilachna vigintioctopunctata TaxID=420089 RepID=A0AAW1U161_9CUCU
MFYWEYYWLLLAHWSFSSKYLECLVTLQSSPSTQMYPQLLFREEDPVQKWMFFYDTIFIALLFVLEQIKCEVILNTCLKIFWRITQNGIIAELVM